MQVISLFLFIIDFGGTLKHKQTTMGGWVDDMIAEMKAGGSQDSIALSYAMAIEMNISNEDTVKVNKFIMQHWGKQALIDIKTEAWKMYLEKHGKK